MVGKKSSTDTSDPNEVSEKKDLLQESASDDKDTPTYWLKWVKKAKKFRPRETHIRDTRDGWREFNGNTDYDSANSSPYQQNPGDNQIGIVYPAYWAATCQLEPSLYSRTPDIVTELRFDIDDPIGTTMALIDERLAEWLMHNSHFDDVMNMAVSDLIHGSKTTTQIIYDAALRDVTKQLALSKVSDTEYQGEDGQSYDGEVKQDPETGEYFGEMDAKEVIEESQKILLAPVPYDEVLHTSNAKIQSDIDVIAYYFCYTKEEAVQKFDEEALEGYPWRSTPNYSLTNKEDKKADRPTETADQYLDGWEVWCRTSQNVYWISEGQPTKFLKDPKKDPYGLREFFPSPPFIILGKPSKTMFPTPAYIHLRPTLLQLHLMYERVFGLIDSVRRRAIVDGDQDVISLLNAGDLEFISAKTLKNIVEKGGLDKMIYYLPVAELVQAISELNSLEDRFKANFDEWFGLPDILKGTSDPIESLGAQEIKANAAQDRFRNVKKLVQRLARDSIELMRDLAYKVFSDQKISYITGYDYMQPEHQQRFAQALFTLRNDEARMVRIGIDTDSMTFVDQGLKTQRLNQVITTVTQGLKQASDMLQVNVPAGVVAMQTLLASLDMSDVGKRFSNGVKNSINQLIQEAMKPKPPPGPPPIDPGVQMQIQSNEKIAMMRLQSDQEYRMAQLNATNTKNQTDASLKAEEINVDTELKQQDQQIATYKIETEAGVKQGDQAIKQTQVQNDAQLWEQENQISAESSSAGIQGAQHQQMLDEMHLALEEKMGALDRVIAHQEQTRKQAEAAIAAQSKFLDEKRLGMESTIEVLKLHLKAKELESNIKQNTPVEVAAPTPAAPPKRKGKRKIIKFNPDGTIEVNPVDE